MKEIKVLLADDHPIVGEGIHHLLEGVEEIDVVGEASNGNQALQMVTELKPDILILDVEMPDISGVEVLNRLSQGSIPVKVLVLSTYDDREYITQVLALGASGYLIKDEVTDVIIDAIQGVARGETGWMSRKVSAKLSQILDERNENKDLTPRELEVLRLLSHGKTNAEISLALSISEKTVEKHLDAIYRKLGVASRVAAAVMAVRDNIV